MKLRPHLQADHLAQKFTEANKHWHLQKLYDDIANAKQQEAVRRCKQLTATEKACLRGLLCNYSSAEIATQLNREPNGLRVDLSRGLYRYIENLTGTYIKNWSAIAKQLDNAGYKVQHQERKVKFRVSVINNNFGKEEEIDAFIFSDRNQHLTVSNFTPPRNFLDTLIVILSTKDLKVMPMNTAEFPADGEWNFYDANSETGYYGDLNYCLELLDNSWLEVEVLTEEELETLQALRHKVNARLKAIKTQCLTTGSAETENWSISFECE